MLNKNTDEEFTYIKKKYKRNKFEKKEKNWGGSIRFDWGSSFLQVGSRKMYSCSCNKEKGKSGHWSWFGYYYKIVNHMICMFGGLVLPF